MIEYRDCKLRLANYSDIDILFKWTNDDDVRRNSFSEEKIAFEDHKKWFDRIMNDPNEIQYIYEYQGKPYGQIRVSIFGRSGEIGYSIQRDKRGKGHGKMMLNLMKKDIMVKHPELERITAKIKPENTASIKVFNSVGFKERYIFMECLVHVN